MQKLILPGLVLGAVLGFLYVPPAHAQATRTWVSGVGNDTNPCTRTQPCQTFAGAYASTAAGGEISVLDPGGFGTLTISKSLSIVNDMSGEAGILATFANGITVNAAATDVVQLRGLVIDGVSSGINGIRFIAGGALHIQNSVIKNFTSSAAGAGNGILFAPAASAQLTITNTVIIHNGSGSTGGGILIKPTGGFSSVTITRTNMDGNSNGLVVDATTTSGSVYASVMDSSASNNSNTGFAMIGGGGAFPSFLTVLRSLASNNSTGVTSTNATGNVLVSDSIVTGNNVGLSPTASGKITTYLNNVFLGNVSQGFTTGTQAGQ